MVLCKLSNLPMHQQIYKFTWEDLQPDYPYYAPTYHNYAPTHTLTQLQTLTLESSVPIFTVAIQSSIALQVRHAFKQTRLETR